ncbi:MAG: hypothetical protein COC19_01165 [SAR86 cluster bacterium]|uniref:Uncharacterized protein n=1 Tax=SAR86 cluster bacterium TaxID=2030880 RepID=A0A2A4MTD9_9GAMM|nr:MAG: hypothetical protein COC19_01165 [SAR86 cluster bacterium]
MYLLLGITLWTMLQKAKSGDRNAALLSSFALVNLLVYFVLAPWTDSTSTSIHWPLSGYFPLLVFAPATLLSFKLWMQTRWSEPLARVISIGVPSIGYLGSIVALLVIGSQAFQTQLQPIVGEGILSDKMAGWNEFSEHTAQLLDHELFVELPVIVTDNYYTAAQVMFSGLMNGVITLDNEKAVRDGRRLQLALWDMDDSALEDVAGRTALFIIEDSSLNILENQMMVESMCENASNITFLDSLSLFNGAKKFSYYFVNHIIKTQNELAYSDYPCPLPPMAWIDPPVANSVLSGTSHIEGWAYNENIGIQSVHLLLNGTEVIKMNYGAVRPDVVDVMNVKNDPNSPHLGFAYEFDTSSFPNGIYTLSIKLISENGRSSIYGKRLIEIEN